ncbi:MAG: hypothetical protein AABM31_09350, partial [Actinomycetota bacterium]
AIGPDGRLYAPLLAGQRLLHFSISGDTLVDPLDQFGELGRQRAATVANGQLYLTTSNGGSDRVMRVPFDGAQAPACPAAPGTLAPPPSARALRRLKRLLVGWSRKLRSVGLRGMRRRGAVKLRVSGLPRGSLGVRLQRRGRVMAAGRRRTSPARSTTLTLKLTKRGRATLRRRPKAIRLVLRGTLRWSTGARTAASRKLVVRR